MSVEPVLMDLAARQLFALTREAALVLGGEGRIVLANAAAGDLLAGEVAALTGTPLADWIDLEPPRLRHSGVAIEWRRVDLGQGNELVVIRPRPRDDLEAYRLMVQATEDFVGIVDHQEGRLFISPSYLRATGYTLEEVLATDFRSRVHPDDLPMVERARQENLRGQQTRLEYRCKRRDGSYLWLDLRATPIPGPSGTVERILWTSRDISERKKLEAELRESRRFIEQVADTVPQMLFVFDLSEMRYVYVNAQCLAIRGFTPGELLRMQPGEAIERVHPDDRLTADQVQERFAAIAEGRVLESRYRYNHPHRGWRRFLTRSLVFRRAPNGRPVQVLGVTEDVTDRTELF